jgi:hypothetical protein
MQCKVNGDIQFFEVLSRKIALKSVSCGRFLENINLLNIIPGNEHCWNYSS